MIEIVLGAATVRVGAGTDVATLTKVLRAVKAATWITVPAGVRVLVATKPVDFRRGADSLAALAKEELQRDPFSGTIFVFRSKRADRLKILAWDGSGLILYWKRLELDTNIVERGIRPIILNRKNALFAGHDEGAENWACVASLVETCKLNDVDPQTYFADVLDKLVNLWPASHIDELMPWAWTKSRTADQLAA